MTVLETSVSIPATGPWSIAGDFPDGTGYLLSCGPGGACLYIGEDRAGPVPPEDAAGIWSIQSKYAEYKLYASHPETSPKDAFGYHGSRLVLERPAFLSPDDWAAMAGAFRAAIEAGRRAYLAGLGRVLEHGAAASDPLTGFLD